METLGNNAKSETKPLKILIVLMGSIGDVLRAMPMLGRLRRAYPAAQISWAVEPKSRSILEGHRWLDELIVYDRAAAPVSFLPFLRRIRAGRFDLVLDLQRHLKSGIVSLVSGAPTRFGFARENTKELNHFFSNFHIAPQPNMRLKLLQYQAFGDALGLPAAPIEFGLDENDEERRHIEAILANAPHPRMGVILGSSWPSRIYFPNSIAAVISALSEPSGGRPALYPLLIGGPEDAVLADEVVNALNGAPLLNLAGKVGLRELGALFRRCLVAFGPDCGPMHIAAAVGCPIVSLWGPTASERSAPWEFANLSITGEIPCHPCYLRDCPVGRECMRRIEPAVVASVLSGVVRERTQVATGSRKETGDGAG